MTDQEFIERQAMLTPAQREIDARYGELIRDAVNNKLLAVRDRDGEMVAVVTSVAINLWQHAAEMALKHGGESSELENANAMMNAILNRATDLLADCENVRTKAQVAINEATEMISELQSNYSNEMRAAEGPCH